MNTIYSEAKFGNFLKYVKFEFVQNRKPLLLSVVCIWAIYILIGILMGCRHNGGGEGETVMFSLCAQIISCIVASMAFVNMKTKEERIFSIMIPASVEVKYFTRWLAVVPVLFGILVVGFYLGDIARIAAFYFTSSDPMNYPNYMKIFNPWSEFKPTGVLNSGLLSGFLFATFFLTQAVYFFGAILWPKLSFIKTFAALYVLQTILGLALMWIFKAFSFTLSLQVVDNLLWGIVVILIVITLLLYYLTYVWFRKSQVVYKLF